MRSSLLSTMATVLGGVGGELTFLRGREKTLIGWKGILFCGGRVNSSGRCLVSGHMFSGSPQQSGFSVENFQWKDVHGKLNEWKFSRRMLTASLSTGNLGEGDNAPSDLAKKKCVPCEGKKIQPLPSSELTHFLEKIPGWELVEVDGIPRLRRSWKVRNFSKGLEFLQRVAGIAEGEGHHPDLHLVGWNNVNIDIWTHSISGLHENDFILAAKIGELDVSDLLRKKKEQVSPPATGV